MDTANKKYHIITYGCQMNVHESEKLAGIMTSLGFSSTDSSLDAEVIIFNTCCIRENAVSRAEGNIGALKKLKKEKKDLIIAVGGCMTQQKDYAQKLHLKFPFIDIIFGTHNLENFRTLLEKKLAQKKTVIEILDKETTVVEGTPRTRTSFPNAWVNIMYGCDNFCTYCIVPYVRGRERSRNADEIVKECEGLIRDGYKEITLLGQNVNSYGKGGNVNFAELLRKVAAIDGDFRLRFMTNHPKDLSSELAEAMKENPKICRLIHLPVQSGSNRILKLMNRHYSREDYLMKAEMLKKEIPNIAITTDVMVGFPTETEEDFLDTFSLMEKMRYFGAFTFIYSPRSGTAAAKMDGQIPEKVSSERITRLINLQNGINREISAEYVGKTVEVLCEGVDEKSGSLLGRDEFGKMAYFNGSKDLIGKFLPIKIIKTDGVSLIGEIALS